MESISRNVGDLSPAEKQVYESVLGHRLQAGQRILVQLIDVDASDSQRRDAGPSPQAPKTADTNGADEPRLPDWCHVYRGLSDEEVDDVERAILARSPASRSVDVDF